MHQVHSTRSMHDRTARIVHHPPIPQQITYSNLPLILLIQSQTSVAINKISFITHDYSNVTKAVDPYGKAFSTPTQGNDEIFQFHFWETGWGLWGSNIVHVHESL